MFFLNMETKFNLVKRTFSDVYGQGYSPKEYKGPQYTQTITPNENYVYVHDCVFSYCSSSSNGGALNCGDTIYKLFVEQTTFISCSTSTSNGGGIYFKSQTNGESVLSKICGFNCSSTSTGPFAYVYTKNDITYKNYVNDSTITHTSILSGYPQRALYLYYGSIICLSVNITNNECYYHTALSTCPTVGSGSPASDTCCISYNSIVNNTAKGGWGCMSFDGSTTSQVVYACNIINNKQTVYSTYEIIFHVCSNVLTKDSCVLGNNKGYDVFYVYQKITISNCTIDDDIISNSRYTGTVIFTKMIERSFIHALSHISTHKCDSYFDSYGTLTAQPIVPSQSTKHPCFGYCMSFNFKRPAINPFRIMEFIFLLTVLPSYPSIDYYIDSNCYLHVALVKN
jgi:hypothetical protein